MASEPARVLFIRNLPALGIFIGALLICLGDSGSMLRSPIFGGMLVIGMLFFWLPLRLVKDPEAGAAFFVTLGSYSLGQGILGIGAWTAVTGFDRILCRISTESVTVVSSSKGSYSNRGQVYEWTDLVVKLPNGHERHYQINASEEHAPGEKLSARVSTGPLFETVDSL